MRHSVHLPAKALTVGCFLAQVHGTKNGALPISLEKRPCGKKVTLIANVTNPKALIFELKGR